MSTSSEEVQGGDLVEAARAELRLRGIYKPGYAELRDAMVAKAEELGEAGPEELPTEGELDVLLARVRCVQVGGDPDRYEDMLAAQAWVSGQTVRGRR